MDIIKKTSVCDLPPSLSPPPPLPSPLSSLLSSLSLSLSLFLSLSPNANETKLCLSFLCDIKPIAVLPAVLLLRLTSWNFEGRKGERRQGERKAERPQRQPRRGPATDGSKEEEREQRGPSGPRFSLFVKFLYSQNRTEKI
jgi:hypothetical protein